MSHSRVGLTTALDKAAPREATHPLTGLVFLALNLITVRYADSHDNYLMLFTISIVSCMTYFIMRVERTARMRDIAAYAMQDTIDHVHMMIQHILHAYFEQHQLEFQLNKAHDSLARFHAEQEQLIAATQSEVNEQYRQILAYAHYLEQRISTRKSESGLREDYDDVCEQAFNLQLIVQAMGMLPSQTSLPALASVPLADRMASILLDLAPNLDRRSMKLTSAEWDEAIHVMSSSEWLTHLLWMVLLGCIRFAEQESTLTLRCQKDGMQAKLDVTVSKLSPGTLTQTERYAYLEKRIQAGGEDAHMFASTLEDHANIRLAKLLASRLMAEVSVTPINDHSCVVSLLLPCSE